MSPTSTNPPSVAHEDGTSCSAAILEQARSIDLRGPDASAFFNDRFKASDAAGEKCAIALVHILSTRIDTSSDPSLRDSYYNTVATFARALSKETIAAVKEAYLRIGYDRDYPKNYFVGLRETHIDIRTALATTVGTDDWASFTGPSANSTENATTWFYYLYLASLETPGALEAIERKLAQTTSGNDAYNLLVSLAELKSSPAKAAVKRVLASFANDARRVDGSNGPGPKLSELIPLQLQGFDP